MKSAVKNAATALLGSIGLLTIICDANAKMDIQEREHVQSLVVLVEFAAFATAVGVAVFVWRLSKRDGKRHREQKNNKPD